MPKTSAQGDNNEPTDINRLVPAFCGNCRAYITGWVSAEDQNEAKKNASDGTMQVSEANDINTLTDYLQNNDGEVLLCRQCGAIMIERTNRTTGEIFMGCPNYTMHPKR